MVNKRQKYCFLWRNYESNWILVFFSEYLLNLDEYFSECGWLFVNLDEYFVNVLEVGAFCEHCSGWILVCTDAINLQRAFHFPLVFFNSDKNRSWNHSMSNGTTRSWDMFDPDKLRFEFECYGRVLFECLYFRFEQ